MEGLPMSSDDVSDLSKMKLGKRAPRLDPRTLQLANYLGPDVNALRRNDMDTLAKMKLGKRAPHHDRRTLLLANYLNLKALPILPAQQDWSGKVTVWGMMKNDTVGDCTCAAAGHLIEEWTSNVGQEVVPTDDTIIGAYSAITGYNPTTGSNDNGAVELDVLNYWRQTGISGHKIDAYVALEPGNHDHVRAAVYIFGDSYIGVALPITAQTQDVWSVPPGGPNGDGAPGSWGGHAVPVVAYDALGLTVVTWGALKRMTWGFWDTYCDEAYAVLSEDFVNQDKIAASGIDLQTLQADLNAITG
jgi:hypothetical protein